MILALAGLVLIAGCSSGSGAGNPGAGSSAAGICGKLIALPCSEYKTTASCEAAIAEARQDAQEAGCAAQYEKALSCTGANLPTCQDGELTTSQACVADGLAYAACDPSVVCSGGGSSTSCTYQCGDTEMECQGGGSSWSCTCTQGPKTGQSFTLDDSTDPCDSTPLKSNCE